MLFEANFLTLLSNWSPKALSVETLEAQYWRTASGKVRVGLVNGEGQHCTDPHHPSSLTGTCTGPTSRALQEEGVYYIFSVSKAVVLNQWVMTPLGQSNGLSQGLLKTIEKHRYLLCDSEQYQN